MSRFEKLLLKILRGMSDANVAFDDLCLVLRHLGFGERVKGSHHIFFKEDVVEILNLQPRNDGKAKAYQVKQVRNLILKYGLGGSDDESTA
jgi:predicted RNA binding protein YcfA (HicA-like mRNA interferase family)